MKSSLLVAFLVASCLAACSADSGELELDVADDLSSEDSPAADDAIETGQLTQALVAGDRFILVNESSQLCLGVDGASTSAGARILQFPCDRSRNQTWTVSSNVTVSGFRPLVNLKSNLCLGVNGGGSASGTDLRQFACDGRNNQQWRPQDRPNSTFRFQNANGLCMGVNGASQASGAQIMQFTCDERVNQRWSVRFN